MNTNNQKTTVVDFEAFTKMTHQQQLDYLYQHGQYDEKTYQQLSHTLTIIHRHSTTDSK